MTIKHSTGEISKPDSIKSMETNTTVSYVQEEINEKQTPWVSVYSCGICSFIQAAQFTVFFSSMWPYLLNLNPNVTESMYGWVVTAYSIAQCLSAPTFGFWSNHIEQVRVPLLFGFAVMIFGNMLYLSLDSLPAAMSAYGMMAARFVTGFGTGNATLLRTYVGVASIKADRFRAIAYVTGGMTIGTMIGPAAQLLFAPLGETGYDLGFVRFNMFTGPAYLSLILNICGFILMKFFFEEYIPDYSAEAESAGGKISWDKVAVGICILSRFSQIFIQTTIETINSPYSIMMFGFSKEDSVLYNASIHGISGVCGVICYAFFILKDLGKVLNHRLTSLLVQFVLVSMFVVTFSWPFLPEKVAIKVPGSDYGCNDKRFTWCGDLTLMYSWIYYGFYVIVFGVAFSFLNVSITTLFTEIIGPTKQGSLQGLFQLFGSLGRLSAPLLMSNLYSISGPRSVWIAAIIEALAVALAWVAFYGRMIPFDERKKCRKEEV